MKHTLKFNILICLCVVLSLFSGCKSVDENVDTTETTIETHKITTEISVESITEYYPIDDTKDIVPLGHYKNDDGCEYFFEEDGTGKRWNADFEVYDTFTYAFENNQIVLTNKYDEQELLRYKYDEDRKELTLFSLTDIQILTLSEE